MSVGPVGFSNADAIRQMLEMRKQFERVAGQQIYENSQVVKRAMDELGEVHMKTQRIQLAAMQGTLGTLIDTYA
jgi:hypothetical protein